MVKKLVLTMHAVIETELDEGLTPEELEEEKERILSAFTGDEGIFSGEPLDWLSEPEFTIEEG